MQELPLRAEELEYKDFERFVQRARLEERYASLGFRRYSGCFPPVFPSLQLLYSKIRDKQNNIVEVSSPKGSGKTLHVMLAYNRLVMNDPEALPAAIYFDPIADEIREIHPSKFTTVEELGSDREWFLEASPRERIKNATHIFVDNFHYVMDGVKEGFISEELPEVLAERVLDELEEGKTIILGTESTLDAYKDMMPEGGAFHQLINELDRHTNRVEIVPPSFNALCEFYGISADEIMPELWKIISDGTPRTFVYLVNKYGEDDKLCWENIRKKLDLENSKIFRDLDPEITGYLVRNPVLPCHPSRMTAQLRKLGITSLDDAKRRLKDLAEEKEKEMEKISEIFNEPRTKIKEIIRYLKKTYLESAPADVILGDSRVINTLNYVASHLDRKKTTIPEELNKKYGIVDMIDKALEKIYALVRREFENGEDKSVLGILQEVSYDLSRFKSSLSGKIRTKHHSLAKKYEEIIRYLEDPLLKNVENDELFHMLDVLGEYYGNSGRLKFKFKKLTSDLYRELNRGTYIFDLWMAILKEQDSNDSTA